MFAFTNILKKKLTQKKSLKPTNLIISDVKINIYKYRELSPYIGKSSINN